MKISRKDFLLGLGGAAAGVPLGALGHRQLAHDPDAGVGRRSYAQAGEDVIVADILQHLRIDDVTYLDIGAYEPIDINNTYFFYRQGHRGVLVEPNVTMCEKLKAVRPRDETLVAGIGVAAAREADYYVMTAPSWNTFSRTEAEHMARVTGGKIRIREVVKMPLLDINDVMAEHFEGAPTFVSIDAEGLHMAILEAIDYARFRPPVICVETLVAGTHDLIPEIPDFMATRNYVARGSSFVNTIFVDAEILRQRPME